MRWQGGRESENVEDRRRMSSGGVMVGGGIGTLVILVLGLLLGADPAALMRQVQQAQGPQAPGGGEDRPPTPAEEEAGKFVRVVLASTEDVWTPLFRQMGREYRKPKLVMFTSRVESACGLASSAMGPFYCPGDEKVYIDLSFFDELAQKFGAPGEFAQAYVIAHEIGHHVQKQLGATDKVHGARGRVSESEQNQLSVMLELQADFYAGVWANHADKMRNILEPGDVEAALTAASAIGDDRLQKQSQGYVVPDSFTHGSSAQRVRWFRKGLETGDVRQGDTFRAREL